MLELSMFSLNENKNSKEKKNSVCISMWCKSSKKKKQKKGSSEAIGLNHSNRLSELGFFVFVLFVFIIVFVFTLVRIGLEDSGTLPCNRPLRCLIFYYFFSYLN